MDEQQLIDRLDAHVADVVVGPPPIAQMRTAVRRRRGRAAVLAAAAAVVVVAAASVGWKLAGDDAETPPVATDVPADHDTPPAAHRYVGIGSAVIAVPEAWSTNETDCGTPQADTVVIDVAVTCAAQVPRPEGVESVEVRPPYATVDIGGWTPFEVDGRRALRAPDRAVNDSGGAGVVRGTVYLPAEEVMFVAESSSAEAATVVDELLDGITFLQDHTTVPGFEDLAYDLDPAPAVESYTERLRDLGLAVEVVERRSPLDRGTVLAADPAVGSVVAPGTTVLVTVSG